MPTFDDEDVRWLLRMLELEGLAELEVTQGDARVTVRAPGPSAPAPEPAASADEPHQDPEGTPVLAPMAGIFYRTPSPDAEPFVEEGDIIERGEVVGLIEAMKLFNDVTSPVAGVITAIVVDNQQRITDGDPLMWVADASA